MIEYDSSSENNIQKIPLNFQNTPKISVISQIVKPKEKLVELEDVEVRRDKYYYFLSLAALISLSR